MPIPDVGQQAPDFSVTDTTGRPFTLSTLFGAGAIVLVFYRGHWCPFCRRQMTRLQANLAEIQARGATLLALSIDEPVLGRALADELGLAFTLLSSPDSSVIDLYGIRNRLLGVKSGVPHPAVFVMDPGGIVRFREVRHNYRRRVSPSRILRWLDKMQGARDTE